MKTLSSSLLVVVFGSGCALTSKADVIDIRYFTPDAPVIEHQATGEGRGAELRLDRVAAGDGLNQRIAYSDGTHEVGYYDDRRWTERPERYVRQSIGRALYERHGLRHVVAGDAPTLDVDVIAFEEIKTKTKHAVRIDLHVQLSDERTVLFEARRSVERPVRDEASFEAVPAAMAAALNDVSEEVATAVVAALQQRGGSASTAAANGVR
jgi:cholesterol transport system auxiliary component